MNTKGYEYHNSLKKDFEKFDSREISVFNSQKLNFTSMKNLIVGLRAISRGTVISHEAPDI